ncbi:MFS general substrate transporter [Thozetella sp. PMI_491]|nr:MFS general substrate transporter [Thozetella sp. PMI_491]
MGPEPAVPSSSSGDDAGDAGARDKYLVSWEEPAENDPENPMAWSTGRKWGIIGTLGFLSFLVPLASSMMAPAVPAILTEFVVTNNQLGTFCVSVFVLGFAFGPLLIAPLSELYGRTIVYHVCNSLFTIFTIACALSKDMGMLVAFRFLAGFAGVAVLTCGSGTIADLMPPETRGKAMAIWSAGPLIGPVVGPVCAGFLVEAKGWQWVFWIIAIVAGAATALSMLVFRETYPPVLLERKAARLRKETGDPGYRSKLQTKGTPKQVFVRAITRPLRMLAFFPIVTAVCVYIAAIYGILYILFTTFTFVFEGTYGFSSVGAGLSFIAGGVGNVLGLFFASVLSDKIVQKRKASGQPPRPEDRLHPSLVVPSIIMLPAGLIMYGWTADKGVHWIAPMIGTGIMGFGMMGVFMAAQTYLVDAYTQHAASVTAANTVLRSILGAVLPLCGLEVYNALGLGWGNTLLGGIMLVMAPIPWALGVFGERLRAKSRAV